MFLIVFRRLIRRLIRTAYPDGLSGLSGNLLIRTPGFLDVLAVLAYPAYPGGFSGLSRPYPDDSFGLSGLSGPYPFFVFLLVFFCSI